LQHPHSTFVKAESTLSLLPFHRFLDASRRYPAQEVVDFWVGPIPAGPGSMEEEDMEEASAMDERADWGWEAEEGDEARIIWRAVGPHTISNQTKRSKHRRTFPPSNNYGPSPACLFWRLGDSRVCRLLLAGRNMQARRRVCIGLHTSKGNERKKRTLTLVSADRGHQPRWLCRFVTWTILKP